MSGSGHRGASAGEYFHPLALAVIAASVADTWRAAKQEWGVDGGTAIALTETACLCGQPRIKYIHTIVNVHNGNVLTPIGSTCITKFGVSHMTSTAADLRELVDMEAAKRRGELQTIHAGGFSRRRIEVLYRYGAFTPSRFNYGDPYNDYLFVLDMFNRRNEPTDGQQRKLDAILPGVWRHLRQTSSGARPREEVYRLPDEDDDFYDY